MDETFATELFGKNGRGNYVNSNGIPNFHNMIA